MVPGPQIEGHTGMKGWGKEVLGKGTVTHGSCPLASVAVKRDGGGACDKVCRTQFPSSSLLGRCVLMFLEKECLL